MKKLNYKECLLMIGNRIKLYRVYLNISQNELEKKTGVSVRTISRLEQGQSVQLDSLIRILYALNLDDKIDLLIPDQSIRPSMFLKETTPLKQRTRKSKDSSETFHWGE